MASISPSGGGSSLSQLLQAFNSKNKPKPYSPAQAFSAPQSGKSKGTSQSLAAAISMSHGKQHAQNGFAAKLGSAAGPASH